MAEVKSIFLKEKRRVGRKSRVEEREGGQRKKDFSIQGGTDSGKKQSECDQEGEKKRKDASSI